MPPALLSSEILAALRARRIDLCQTGYPNGSTFSKASSKQQIAFTFEGNAVEPFGILPICDILARSAGGMIPSPLQIPIAMAAVDRLFKDAEFAAFSG